MSILHTTSPLHQTQNVNIQEVPAATLVAEVSLIHGPLLHFQHLLQFLDFLTFPHSEEPVHNTIDFFYLLQDNLINRLEIT